MIEEHQTVRQLRGIAVRLTGDFDLRKDLLQEMLIHLTRLEADQPGQTASWYLQGCHFRARDYLMRGRSVNSIKRRNEIVSLDETSEEEDGSVSRRDAPDPIDLHGELLTRDVVDLMLPHLTSLQQQILLLLMHECGGREIARELRVSHPTVLKHRKLIASRASALLADARASR